MLDAFATAVRNIMLNEWDPQNVARNPHASGAYDSYIEPLTTLLLAAPTEDQVVEWLHEKEQATMCFPSLGTQRLRPIARKLMAIDR